MKKINQLTVLVFALTLVVASIPACKKYEDGPGLSFRSKTKRLVNNWKLDKYLWNGSDKTSSLLITNYTEEYTEDGTYSRSYNDDDGDPFSDTGNWEFDDEKDNILIKGVSSIELTDENSTVTNTKVTILKLKKKELWYHFENGGDDHEFHLVQK